MAWEYTFNDRELAKFALLKLQPAHGGDPMLGDKLLSNKPFGCGSARGLIADQSDGTIEFQFPPKITSDNRRGTWKEGENRGDEPVAVFATSGPREMTLKWTYVIDSAESTTEGGWTIKRITKNIRTLRGYFALVRNGLDPSLVGTAGGPTHKQYSSARSQLIVMMKFWCIGGVYPITGRIKAVDVKYGETMISEKKLGISPNFDIPEEEWQRNVIAYPLRTDVVVDLRLWTKLGVAHASEIAPDPDAEGAEEADVEVEIEGLQKYMSPDWY